MHQSILDYARQGKIKDVGTTMALAVFGRTSIQIANLGDSRIYCLTGNHLERLSRDHVLEASGRMKPPLVQYLGMDDSEYQMTPHVRKLSYQDNMQLFLCSDGVTDMMSEQEIEEVLHNENSISEKVEKLKKVILQRGARDNTTMILAEMLRSSLFG
jgi:protein phosphatase